MTSNLKSLNLKPEMRALIERRIAPFVDSIKHIDGIDPNLLLTEAYLRGLEDAKAAMAMIREKEKEEGR